MSTYDYDLFTLGAGSGGVRASRMAARFGATVGLAEGRFLGGTCVNVGCVPKKLMVYAAQVSDALRDAAGFGWTVPPAHFDWATLAKGRDAEVRRLNGVYGRMLHGVGVEVIDGWARFADAHTLDIALSAGGHRRVTAERILVTTGGAPVRPDIPGAERALVSDDLFTLPARPDRAVVVGGGYIAVEFACILHGLGTDVTLVHRGPHLLRGFDEDLRAHLTEQLRARGVRLILNHTVRCIESEGDGRQVVLEGGDSIDVDAAFFAIGRRPSTGGLGLAEAGVELGAKGEIRVDADYATSVPHIFALGDVTDRINLTPVAIEEGIAFARTQFAGQPTRLDYANVPTAVFSTPPMATVGLTEAQARQAGARIDVYTSEFRPMKNTLSGNGDRSLMKLVVDRDSDRVLGVHMVGADAPEIIQGFAVALVAGATKASFDATVGIHPTAAEEFVTMRERRNED